MSKAHDILKNRALLDLMKAFKGQQPVAKVGILGGKTHTGKGKSQGVDNATIGAAHEFGTEKLPQRSFLRMPISDNLFNRVAAAGGFSEAVIKEVIHSKSLVDYVAKMGILGEQIVAEAFDTGGFGQWKPSDMDHKKNHQTLVETQQLRNSITSEVK